MRPAARAAGPPPLPGPTCNVTRCVYAAMQHDVTGRCDGTDTGLMRRLPPMGALEAFVVVAHRHRLTAAAADLNLSVSAISRRIQALETYVGGALFDRLHHEVRLTPLGDRLLEDAAPLVDGLARVLADLSDGGPKRLTIGVPPSFASAWLLPRLPAFRAACPDIDLSFDSSGSPLARLGGSLDAAIVFAATVPPDVHGRVLRPQAGFAIAAPGLVPAGTTPREALDRQVFLLHSGLPAVLPAWTAALGLDGCLPRRTDYFDSGPMLLAAAESGLGVALCLEDMVNFSARAAQLARPFGEAVATTYSYYFVSRSPVIAGRALRRFHDWLFDAAQVAESATGVAPFALASRAAA